MKETVIDKNIKIVPLGESTHIDRKLALELIKDNDLKTIQVKSLHEQYLGTYYMHNMATDIYLGKFFAKNLFMYVARVKENEELLTDKAYLIVDKDSKRGKQVMADIIGYYPNITIEGYKIIENPILSITLLEELK